MQNYSSGAELLFDERPKVNRKELYNRDSELKQLADNINRPLILLTGVRRIGKTSLLNVFLHESEIPFILIDARSLSRNYGISDMYRIVAKGMSSSMGSIYDVLSKIKRVRILGNEIELAWKGKDYISLSELFDGLNQKRLIIAIDEAQLLRGPNSTEIKNALAHSYDYNRNLTFIVTGSEVGLLYNFLGTEDEGSPLFGRSYFEVKLGRFSRESSIGFLEAGFKEARITVSGQVIEEAVSEFDGIVGWLTYFGNQWVSGTRDSGLIRKKAISIARGEIMSMQEGRSSRFLVVLKCLAKGKDSWTGLKRCIEEAEGKTISTSVLDNAVRVLEYLNLINDYQFLDPIYREAAREL